MESDDLLLRKSDYINVNMNINTVITIRDIELQNRWQILKEGLRVTDDILMMHILSIHNCYCKVCIDRLTRNINDSHNYISKLSSDAINCDMEEQECDKCPIIIAPVDICSTDKVYSKFEGDSCSAQQSGDERVTLNMESDNDTKNEAECDIPIVVDTPEMNVKNEELPCSRYHTSGTLIFVLLNLQIILKLTIIKSKTMNK